MRHSDVLLCPIGAFAMYLFYRFKYSMEMSPPPDFRKNEEWFQMKLYTDGKPGSNDKSVKARVYSDVIGRVFKMLGVATNHTAHLGRILGPKKLEMLEFSQDEIRVLGNWDPKTQESTYSTKLPMRCLRAMAGFDESGGMHYSPRVAVEVPNELKNAVFPWLEDSIGELNEFELQYDVSKPTARQFLKMMSLLAPVLIQDVAVIMIQFPERCADSLLMQDPMFKTPTFLVSVVVCVLFLYSMN